MMESPNRRGDDTNSEGESMPLHGASMDDKLDVVVRHGFVRKVFGIVGVQLVATSLIAYLFKLNEAALRSPAAMVLWIHY